MALYSLEDSLRTIKELGIDREKKKALERWLEERLGIDPNLIYKEFLKEKEN